ncbi:MAG: hypothetical protein IKC09_01315 [Oscillospiraceae bacterium]|nr:hypothetical protein [Oscillospiraceae bacterium]
MRTIIINTLGRELRKNPLFFLPFREDQMFWLEQDLNNIESCVGEISGICNDQIKRQDYRLVVLADPVCFHMGQVAVVREAYKKLILAMLNRRLLGPLASQSNLIPRSVTVVFLISHQEDGSKGINAGEVLDHIFGISAQDQPIRQLRVSRILPGGNLEYLDVTELFATALKDHLGKMELRKQYSQTANMDLVYDDLRAALKDDLEALQNCSYVPTGGTSEINLTIHLREFVPKTTVPQLIWADLQLNLCDHLVKQVLHPNEDTELALPAHTQKDLEARISRASSRVDYLLNTAPRQSYYPLKNQPRSSSSSLQGQIWDTLSKEASQLPGVAEARHHSENPNEPRPDHPSEKLQRAWFRVGQEKKLFHDLCTRLDAEYNEELVTEQQQSILDLCARGFRQWRSQALRKKPALPQEADQATQPELDDGKLRKELAKAQQECARVTVEKLADYSDVRQEAEVIKARFRKAGRFWSPDCGSVNTHNFQAFSGILALIFLAQLMLPYLGITLGQANVTIDRYAHFLLSIAVFAGIYVAGLLFWLRGLCEELHGYAKQMSELIWKSARRREDSIEAAVNAYSDVLPRCMNLSDDLRELEMIHAVNENRKDNYAAHMSTLKKARELLQELATQLQLPDSDRYNAPVQAVRTLDYHQPPSHRSNLAFYTLLSDKWGDPSC